jgi:hypothetical protein
MNRNTTGLTTGKWEKKEMRTYAVHDAGYQNNPRQDVCGACIAPDHQSGAVVLVQEHGEEFVILEPALLATEEAKTEFAECLKGEARRHELRDGTYRQTNGDSVPMSDFSMFRFLSWDGHGEAKEITRDQFLDLGGQI